jgi:cleavage stimulation factor subunit 1
MGTSLLIRITCYVSGKQEHKAQAVFNHTEDYVLFPDEATTSLCAWNSRNASRKQLLSLGKL